MTQQILKYTFLRHCTYMQICPEWWKILEKHSLNQPNFDLICRANQLTGFYMMATLAFNELISAVIDCKTEKQRFH